MSFTNTITVGSSYGGGATAINQNVTLTGNVLIMQSFSVPISSTTNVALAWVNTALQSIVITADKAITLKTNSSTSPQDTIAIAAGGLFLWYKGSGSTNPFVGDVTNTYWINASATDIPNINVRVLTHPSGLLGLEKPERSNPARKPEPEQKHEPERKHVEPAKVEAKPEAPKPEVKV